MTKPTKPTTDGEPQIAAETNRIESVSPALPGGHTGLRVLVRTFSAGVHVGQLVRRSGKDLTLANAHRIWRWRGANTLNELAVYGASMTSLTRISEAVPEIILTEAIEIIPVSADAWENLTAPRWL